MRLLLDTHVLIAMLGSRTGAFGARIRGLLEDPEGEFVVSVASLWEIAIKSRLGKLRLSVEPDEIPQLIDGLGIELLPIAARHVLASVEPEPTNKDPFDYLLLAQCGVENLKLLTADRALVGHPWTA